MRMRIRMSMSMSMSMRCMGSLMWVQFIGDTHIALPTALTLKYTNGRYFHPPPLSRTGFCGPSAFCASCYSIGGYRVTLNLRLLLFAFQTSFLAGPTGKYPTNNQQPKPKQTANCKRKLQPDFNFNLNELSQSPKCKCTPTPPWRMAGSCNNWVSCRWGNMAIEIRELLKLKKKSKKEKNKRAACICCPASSIGSSVGSGTP